MFDDNLSDENDVVLYSLQVVIILRNFFFYNIDNAPSMIAVMFLTMLTPIKQFHRETADRADDQN